jgi:hypothetical protein
MLARPPSDEVLAIHAARHQNKARERCFRVMGPRAVHGVPPGQVGFAMVTEGEFDALLISGHVQEVLAPKIPVVDLTPVPADDAPATSKRKGK